MTVDVETGPLLIGTTVGGDTSSLEDLAIWVSNTLQPIVDSAGQKLGNVVERVPEVWQDEWASSNLIDMLKQGRNDTNELADRLVKVAELIRGCGPAITDAQSNLQGVADNAVKDKFEVTEEGIWYPEDPDLWDFAGNPALMWEELENQADAAISPIASQMEAMANDGIWTSVLFTSGSIVSQASKDLLEQYETGQRLSSGSSQRLGAPLLDSLEPRAMGILECATKAGGPVIDGLQAAYGLYQGKRADQVLVEAAVGTAALYGARKIGWASARLLVAGSFAPGVGLALFAGIVVYVAITAPSDAGDLYIRHVAMDSRSRIAQSGGENPYDESDPIIWGKRSESYEREE